MKICEVLSSTVSNDRPIIYHGTSLDSAESILQSNAFDIETSFSRSFGVSLMFAADESEKIGVVFVLDYNKIRQDNGKNIIRPSSDARKEQEERSTYTIENISKYILEIDVIGTKKLINGLNVNEYPLVFNNDKTKVVPVSEKYLMSNVGPSAQRDDRPVSRRQFHRKVKDVSKNSIPGKDSPSIHKGITAQFKNKYQKNVPNKANNSPFIHGNPAVWVGALNVGEFKIKSTEVARDVYNELRAIFDSGTSIDLAMLKKVIHKHEVV